MIETLLKYRLFTGENFPNYLKIYFFLASAIEFIHEKGMRFKIANIFIDKKEVRLETLIAIFEHDVKDGRYDGKMFDDCLLDHTKNEGTPLYAS
jgi:hypothetical protein